VGQGEVEATSAHEPSQSAQSTGHGTGLAGGVCAAVLRADDLVVDAVQ
jgi:hypothetical protein